MVHAGIAGSVRLLSRGKPTLFDRVANEQVGEADLVIAEFQTQAEQAVDDDPVVGGDALGV